MTEKGSAEQNSLWYFHPSKITTWKALSDKVIKSRTVNSFNNCIDEYWDENCTNMCLLWTCVAIITICAFFTCVVGDHFCWKLGRRLVLLLLPLLLLLRHTLLLLIICTTYYVRGHLLKAIFRFLILWRWNLVRRVHQNTVYTWMVRSFDILN